MSSPSQNRAPLVRPASVWKCCSVSESPTNKRPRVAPERDFSTLRASQSADSLSAATVGCPDHVHNVRSGPSRGCLMATLPTVASLTPSHRPIQDNAPWPMFAMCWRNLETLAAEACDSDGRHSPRSASGACRPAHFADIAPRARRPDAQHSTRARSAAGRTNHHKSRNVCAVQFVASTFTRLSSRPPTPLRPLRLVRGGRATV